MPQRTCFVISPIGEKDTDIRRKADCALEYIIKPAFMEMGYADPIRVDRLDKPTHITSEIVQHLINSDMVVADLSGANANVFYELGIRHAYKKPCIMISDWEPRPPFDVGHVNTIRYRHDDPSSHREAQNRIRRQIEQFESGSPVSNPVTVAVGMSALEESGDEKDKIIATLSKQYEELSGRLRDMEREVERFADRPPSRNVLADLYADPGRKPERVVDTPLRLTLPRRKVEKTSDEHQNALRKMGLGGAGDEENG